MAENYKLLYEQMKKMVAVYQDEIVPGLRDQLAQKWIPVTERLPKSLEVVFVRRQFGLVGTGDYFKGCGINKWLGKKNKVFPVTHWMPIPEAPKEGE